jgi:hypothetical protein
VALLSLNREPNARLLRQFAGIWFPAACGVIGFALWRRTGSWTWPLALWVPAAVIGVAGVVRPSVMKPIWVVWMTAVFPIGWTISHLVLAMTYYLVITPVGLLLRMTGRDPMERTLDRQAQTYWRRHQQITDPARYFRQF